MTNSANAANSPIVINFRLLVFDSIKIPLRSVDPYRLASVQGNRYAPRMLVIITGKNAGYFGGLKGQACRGRVPKTR